MVVSGWPFTRDDGARKLRHFQLHRLEQAPMAISEIHCWFFATEIERHFRHADIRLEYAKISGTESQRPSGCAVAEMVKLPIMNRAAGIIATFHRHARYSQAHRRR
jgi:hypothetical protein